MVSFKEIPSYVISCEGDEERRLVTEKRFNEKGIEFEFFNASDGYHLPKEIFEQENIFLEHEGARGVSLSHKRLWRKMVEENIPYMAIYEDDVIFHPQFHYFADIMWNQTEERDNSISFMGFCCFHLGGNNRETQPQIVQNFPLALHAYIITKPVAEWFLNNYGRVTENIDIHMQKLFYQKKPNFHSYVWWNGIFTVPEQKSTKFNVYFNGFCYQDHDIKLSIHRNRKEGE